jgi:hypothetical protein
VRQRSIALALAPLALAPLVLAGCVSQDDVRHPLQEHMAVSARVMGFALDAQLETLELKLAMVRKDPSLAASLGTEAQIMTKLDRVKTDQKQIQEELQRLKAKYPVEGDKP